MLGTDGTSPNSIVMMVGAPHAACRALQAERDQLRARLDGVTDADEVHTSVAVGRVRQEAEDAKAALRLRLREAERQHQVRTQWNRYLCGHWS